MVLNDIINRDPYNYLYLLLQNEMIMFDTSLYDDIDDQYRKRGLHNIVCTPNASDDPNFEFMYVVFAKNGIKNIYISLFKPEYIINMSDLEITQEEKDALYDFTSTHWDLIIETYRKLYADPIQEDELHEYCDLDFDAVVYPGKSPDYRLLPAYSPKKIIVDVKAV